MSRWDSRSIVNSTVTNSLSKANKNAEDILSLINTLLVGGGRMGSAHLEGIAKTPDLASVTAVVEPYQASHQRLRETYGIDHLHVDLASALAAEAVDAVFICTPNNLHAEYALQSLRVGKHVF
ncbi:MAG TPA: hypothetical protein EYQ31_14360, partial [Candidatus Handelsmanbacteria bacterium]|nr:hypothetical protein [Candidatus Handelsmanbacteria bacterium]